jgi:hypothetical protein
MNFNNIPCIKISKKLVHKDQDEDVFIYNDRTALPAFFDIELSQLAKLDGTHIDAIRSCYTELGSEQGDPFRMFCLKGVPASFHSGQKVYELLSGNRSHLLDAHYSKTDDVYTIRNAAMPEAVQNEIIFLLSSKALSESDRYQAAVALKKLPEVVSPSVFHCTVYNDTKHYYFYSKRHEHVPGIMIIEIARQAFYAHYYRFSKHSRESINISIADISCEFIGYLNSSYPVLISVETISLAVDGPVRETVRLRATFSQRGSPKAVVEILSGITGIKLFKRLRDVSPPAADVFSLIHSDTDVQVLVRSEAGDYIEGRLRRMSADTLFVQIPDSHGTIEHDVSCKFHFFTTHFGFISGDGVISRDDPRSVDGDVAIRISSWPRGCEAKAREFIKMDCFLVE